MLFASLGIIGPCFIDDRYRVDEQSLESGVPQRLTQAFCLILALLEKPPAAL
jgi:hypothetical protein